VIKESKTKYMKINRNITNLKQDLIIYGQVLQGVLNFRYLDASINSKNLISDEIISSIVTGNRYSNGKRQIFRSRAMSKAVKIKTYKKLVKPTVVFGSETWAVAEMDMNRLGSWEGKY
jgi:hypothetical protein